MPVSHEPIPAHVRARSRPLRVGVVALIAIAIATPLDSVAARVETVVPARAAAAAAAEPHPVPPAITKSAVSAVAPTDRGGVVAGLDGDATDATAGGTLVAHVRKPLIRKFAMVGVTWDAGTAAEGTTVSVRTRSEGTWSDWSALVIDADEGPAPVQEDSVRDGTAPAWVGPATGVEVAVYSTAGTAPAAVSVDTIDPGISSYDAAATTSTGSLTGRAGPEAGTFPGLPDVITRTEWGVDPSLGDKCWKPRFGDSFKGVFVHHTAGSNNYTRSESAAVVRGVYAYHTQARGWCDIGYNFLVDRFGKIYEGRRGGIRMPVRGSHAGDYNADSTGISLMGDFTSQNATRPMKHSLVQLIAWRMGSAYRGAYGRPYIYDRKFARIAGHRDAMSTSCPGEQVYAWLPTLRERVATRLGNYESKIEDRWRQLGGPDSRLGDVRIGEQVENGGHHTRFKYGRMYSSSAGLNVLYRSPILAKYRRAGETGGKLGYPASNLRSIVDHTGLSAEFEGGRIFWSRRSGSTVLLRSAILKRYLAEGSAAGRLGFPTVPVHPITTGALARFQHGTIAWDTARHKTLVSFS